MSKIAWAKAKTPSLRALPALLVLSEMLVYLSNDMYVPALPGLAKELNITNHEVQLTLSAWFFGAAMFQLLIGPVTDRIGRRPVVILGMILFVIATWMCCVTTHIHLLLLARFMQGSIVGFVVVAGYASIHELYNQKDAIHLLAIMGSITILAPSLGPVIGGLILLIAEWRWTFWPLLAVGIMALLALFQWMPESLPDHQRHPLKILTLLRQYWRILINQRFMFLLLTSCFLFAGLISWIVTGPFLVINQFHHKPVVFGMLQSIIFGFFLLASSLVKYLMQKMSIHRLIVSGLSVALFGGALAVFASYLTPHILGNFIAAMTVFSFGGALALAPLARIGIEASSEPMGSRMAITSSCISLGGLCAALLMSHIYHTASLPLAICLLGASLLACVCYGLAIET